MYVILFVAIVVYAQKPPKVKLQIVLAKMFKGI